MGLARGWVVRALVLLPLWGCGVGRGGDEGRAARHLSLTCNPAWNPAWSQGGSAGPWWVEYAIGGGKGKVVSAWLEASDQQLLLTEQWGKWSASPPRKLEAGTPIVVHALNDRYQTASTYAFGYLAEAAPLTDPCGGQCVPRCGANLCGDDGCGGSCGLCPEGTACEAGSCVEYIAPQRVCSGGECTCIAPWNPFWQQVNANDYWVEYTVSRGTVKSVWLEVVGGDRTDLKLEWGRWVGAPRTAIAAGTPVVLHARDDARHSAQTAPFGYLTTPVA